MVAQEKPAKKAGTPEVVTNQAAIIAAKKQASLAAILRAQKGILKITGQKNLNPKYTRYHCVSTGSSTVDMLIGGTLALDGKGPICPGFPKRHITEVYGPESSGKTTLAISAMVQAQRGGGSCMFIDFEHSLDHNYAKALGLNYDDGTLLVYQPDTMEEGLKHVRVGIATGVDIIVVDSVSAMVPLAELQKDIEDAAKIGVMAAKLSGVLPKLVLWLAKDPCDGKGDDKKPIVGHEGTALVLINQIRSLINTSGGGGGHGDNENTSGGKALKFFSYLRLRASKIKSEMVAKTDPVTGKKVNKPYGNLTTVKVVKSKVDAKQGHSTQMFIRYGYGIDDYHSIIESGIIHGIIKRGGSKYTYGSIEVQGKDKFRQYLISNLKVFDEIKAKWLAAVQSEAKPLAQDEPLDDADIFDTMSDEQGDIDLDSEETVLEAADAEESSASE